MPEILVADDSPFDRSVARRVISAMDGWTACFVDDGSEAIELLARHEFDLVLTDLVMPRINGLELLEHIQANAIAVPVVVMTSQGSEEIAVQALQTGAANYIQKKRVVRELAQVLESVITAARTDRAREMLLQHLAGGVFQFALPNDRTLLSAAISFLQESAAQLGHVPRNELTRLGIALEEALSNAMIHGNLEVYSQLREHDNDAYERLIAERCNEVPYCDRRVFISSQFEPDRLIVTVRDEGLGFDAALVPDPTDAENLFRPSGRGLMLIHAFMDSVTHNEMGNEITMVKHFTRRPQDRVAVAESTLAALV
ncbi:Adenylate cyclase 2 [Maioricimonas rarisocia]|uniref:Adenylate cyclase 2 n=1 Tax=Maioricimonas rarisocia TaxID=2528026 RepID=A0A517ZEJ4_9PLAN|nr:response regulator [Maioricimonas rarisocia]QDU40891.1 Adenylate cyclase 2 [Maioricimonas rarisocia]